MGSSPKQPKIPEPKQPPPAPQVEDKAVQEAAAEAIRRKQKGRGYMNTVIARDMVSSDMSKKLETLGT